MRTLDCRSLIAALVLATSAIPVQASPNPAGHGAHWAYDGGEGPARWGELSPDYALCSSGRAQSPIDIVGGKPATLPGIGLQYPQSDLRIVNNGHTIQLNYAADGGALLGGQPYRLAQFHFHSPSEHKLNGQSFPMEVHLVHKDTGGQLAVIGVFFKEGRANPFLGQFWAKLPKQAGGEQSPAVSLRIEELLPTDKSYYHYGFGERFPRWRAEQQG